MGKVSGKTHTKEQLDNWANQNNPNNKAYWANVNNRSNQLNPNNKAYRANVNNRSNQLNPNNKAHQAKQNSRRRNKPLIWPDWAPDYPEYD